MRLIILMKGIIMTAFTWAQDGQITIVAVGQPEAGGSSAVAEQQEPLLAGQQQKVRLLACCCFMMMLQWQGSAWGVDRGQPLTWQQRDSGAGSRQLLWEPSFVATFWKGGQMPEWARCESLSIFTLL